MDNVLAVYPEDSQARVQPGVGWSGLNEELAERGHKLFFPIDPAPGAQFGGMVGVGGSGTNAVGYGTMRAEWIQGMEVSAELAFSPIRNDSLSSRSFS